MMRTSSVATGLHDKDKVSWIEEVRVSVATGNIYGKIWRDSRNWFSVVAWAVPEMGDGWGRIKVVAGCRG